MTLLDIGGSFNPSEEKDDAENHHHLHQNQLTFPSGVLRGNCIILN